MDGCNLLATNKKLWNHFFFFLDLLAYSFCLWKKNLPTQIRLFLLLQARRGSFIATTTTPRCLRPAWTLTLGQALCVVRRDDRTALDIPPGNEPARVRPPAAERLTRVTFLAAELL